MKITKSGVLCFTAGSIFAGSVVGGLGHPGRAVTSHVITRVVSGPERTEQVTVTRTVAPLACQRLASYAAGAIRNAERLDSVNGSETDLLDEIGKHIAEKNQPALIRDQERNSRLDNKITGPAYSISATHFELQALTKACK